MEINYKRPFYQYVKKVHKPLKLAIEDTVELICGNPEIGESKVGDLVGIHVYKFSFNRQEYLIAYRCLMDSPAMDSTTKLDILSILIFIRLAHIKIFIILLNAICGRNKIWHKL
jgi:hypothetical protein